MSDAKLETNTVEAMVWRPGVDQAGLAITENALKSAISQFRSRLPTVVGVDFRPDSRAVGVVQNLWYDEAVAAMMCQVQLTDEAGIKWASYDVQGSLRPAFYVDQQHKSNNTGFQIVTGCRLNKIDMLVLQVPSRLPDPYKLYL